MTKPEGPKDIEVAKELCVYLKNLLIRNYNSVGDKNYLKYMGELDGIVYSISEAELTARNPSPNTSVYIDTIMSRMAKTERKVFDRYVFSE